MTYYDLLVEADNDGLVVKEAPLKSCDGRCKGKRIAIRDTIPTLRKKADVLAEEMGHYYATVGRIIELDAVNSRKQERAARLWGYNKRFGLTGLIHAWENGCQNLYEIADYLDVSEDTLSEALECYRQKYGTGIWIDDYKIQFELFLNRKNIYVF